MNQVPHEYGPSRVGHGEAQCIHCLGTNRENAIINARLRAALAELIPLAAHPDYPEGDDPAVGRALLWEKKHG